MPLQEHPFPQRHCLFPRSAPEVDPGIFNQPSFQNFQGTVCGSFGIFFQYHCPDSGQRTIEVMEPHGGHSVHIDFCVSHQLRKFFVGHHLAQKPGIDPSAFQKRHGFIGQMQFRQRGVDLLPVFCPAEQIVNGHLIKVCQCDKAAVIDFLISVFFIFIAGYIFDTPPAQTASLEIQPLSLQDFFIQMVGHKGGAKQ